MWNHLKTMKKFLLRALVIVAISAFVISLVFSIIYNRRSYVENSENYYSEENYRLDYNLYVIEKIINDWKKDMDFFSNIVRSNPDIRDSLSDDTNDQIIPKWLERQMFHSGYTAFEYHSFEEIRHQDEEELADWLVEIPDEVLFSTGEDQVFISWMPADSEYGNSFNSFRVTRPIWLSDDRKGVADGVYSFVYPSDKLISGNKLEQGAEISHLMLIDSSTRVIVEFDDRPTRTIVRAIQEVRNAVNSSEQGSIITGRGVYFWRQIELPEEITGVGLFTSNGRYYLLSEVVAGTDAYTILSGSGFSLFVNSLIDSLIPFIVLFIFGIGLIFLLALRKHQQIKAKYLTDFDQMSGTYNRYTGLQRIQHVWEESENLREISICFIDINGLKQVNDMLGHDCGDELIKTVAYTIKNNIRRDDFVIRMGGDEFMIVLPGVPVEQAELIWVRIKKEMKEINQSENRDYLVSASHGIAVIKAEHKDKLEDYIVKADTSMYEEKRRVKAGLNVIKDTVSAVGK